MADSVTTTIRIDTELKQQATDLFDELGITMSAAITTFLKAAIREQGMPFDLKIATDKTSGDTVNSVLNSAFIARKDEFYTDYGDIETEVSYYPDAFEGKVVLCNCDDPFESAFFRFFAQNFNNLGLAKLISTSYAGSAMAGTVYPLRTPQRAYKAIVTAVPEEPLLFPDGSLDVENLFTSSGNSLSQLLGDGDFRSTECVELLEQADIVVTNPPFSLFRDYMRCLVAKNKQFLVLGNMNAATTRDIFPLFRDGKAWYGPSIRSGDRKFYVPDSYPLHAAGCGVDQNGRKFIRVKGVRWFTNLDHEALHAGLELTHTYSPETNPVYDNYDAIEVPRTKHIPMDYDGIMGVPITFLDSYSPDQFDILMLANGNARTNTSERVLGEARYSRHPDDRGGVAMLNGRRSYARILIRKRK